MDYHTILYRVPHLPRYLTPEPLVLRRVPTSRNSTRRASLFFLRLPCLRSSPLTQTVTHTSNNAEKRSCPNPLPPLPPPPARPPPPPPHPPTSPSPNSISSPPLSSHSRSTLTFISCPPLLPLSVASLRAHRKALTTISTSTSHLQSTHASLGAQDARLRSTTGGMDRLLSLSE